LAVIDFSYFFDLVMFSLALGAAYFVYYLSKAFKGGVMGLPFKVLTMSLGLLTASETCSLAGFFLRLPNLFLIQESLDIGFLIFALFGFYKLYAFWRFDFIGQVQTLDSSSLAQLGKRSDAA
jgi:hypothetical protein